MAIPGSQFGLQSLLGTIGLTSVGLVGGMGKYCFREQRDWEWPQEPCNISPHSQNETKNHVCKTIL